MSTLEGELGPTARGHAAQAWRSRLDAHYDEALEALVADGRSLGDARVGLGRWPLLLLSAEAMSS